MVTCDGAAAASSSWQMSVASRSMANRGARQQGPADIGKAHDQAYGKGVA